MQTKAKLLTWSKSEAKGETVHVEERQWGAKEGELCFQRARKRMEMLNEENSVIWTSVGLLRDLLRGHFPDVGLQSCSSWERWEKGSVGVEMFLLSLIAPLFASLLHVGAFPAASCPGSAAPAASSESSQRLDARATIISSLPLSRQTCKHHGAWQLSHLGILFPKISKTRQPVEGIPMQD